MKRETSKNTTNSSVYKKIYWKELSTKESLCPLCGPHSGCNGGYGRYEQRNWKKFRNTQWK